MSLSWEQVKGLSVNFSVKNIWRHAALHYEIDDLLHECYIVYRNCCDSYGNLNDDDFRRAYKSSLINMSSDLQKKSMDILNHVVYLDNEILDEDGNITNTYQSSMIEEEVATLNLMINMAPEKIKNIMNCIEKFDGPHEITNKYLCSKLGYNYNLQHPINDFKKYILS